MAKIIKINHVGIAVPEIDASLGFWKDVLGLDVEKVEEATAAKSRIAFLPVGDSDVELVMPLSDEAGTAKMVKEKGGGIHHLCFEVDDIEGMLAQLKAHGVRLIDETPREMPGRKMAFVHPKSTGGVLIEFYQLI